MSTAADTLRLHSAPLPAIDTDILIVPIFEQDTLDDLPGLDIAADGDVTRVLASKEFKAKLFESMVVRLTDWKASRLLIVGGGQRSQVTSDRWRKMATAAGLVARQRRAGRAAFLWRGPVADAYDVQAIGEGLILALFDVDRYKTEHDAAPILDLQIVVSRSDPALDRAVHRARILGTSSNMARELANEPGNLLPPRVFAERAEAIIASTGVSFEALDERRLESLNMGLLLGVSRGSAEPPRLMSMRHAPTGVSTGPVLGLVGKGVTFDTGGISLKPADGMERMKDDMAGGAAVVAAMRAVGMLQAPIRVVGVVPAVENMPGGRAIRPGDVLTSASGKTIEVNNTDAEGRLILGDALWYARQQGVTHLVDIATLTGACVVALGKVLSGLFGTPEAWVERVRRTAERAGDRCWPMPTYDEYLEQLKSDIADLVNTGGRPAGAITAAMFLKEFAGGLPWAHLDIAGTAWAEEAKPFQPKGPIGVAVRTLTELALSGDGWA